MLQHGAGGFKRIAVRAVWREQRKPQVDIGEHRAADQSAHPDRRAVALQLHGEQPHAVLGVHALRTLLDVAPRSVQVPRAFIADEAQILRVIEQRERKGRIGSFQWAQGQAGRLKPDHELLPQTHPSVCLVDCIAKSRRSRAASRPGAILEQIGAQIPASGRIRRQAVNRPPPQPLW